MEDAFVEDFKTSSFCKCVESGSNQTLDDVSCRYPDYLYSEAQTISNLAKLEGDKIRIDSIRRVGRVAEGMEGKRAIEMCLKFYKSRELDSVARARFKLSEKAMKNAQNN
ncbi:hypothetical protein [Pontibacter ummariensis]|uniref:hypothetical protein n=1 Tax=Pontibacter ummariensis TaxID=1610492 RepID=UPI001185ED76|nr:hypothetical protein [Pontibacter ummariensis]